MSKTMNANTAWIIAAILIIGMVLGVLYYYGNHSKNLLEMKAQCAEAGSKWIAQNPDISAAGFIVTPEYAYSPGLQTCLVNVQRKAQDGGSLHEIYDVYSNNTIASYVLSNGTYDYSSTTIEFEREYQAAEKKYFSQ